MAYKVIAVTPVPPTELDVQNEIHNATNNGDKLICIEIDPPRDRLLIVTQS